MPNVRTMKIRPNINILAFACAAVVSASTKLPTLSDVRTRDSFHHLFDSIAKNNAEEVEKYRVALREESGREKEAFDTFQNEIRTKRKQNFNTRHENEISHQAKRNVDSNATVEDEKVYIFPEITNGDALQPALDLLSSQKEHHEQLAFLFEQMWERNTQNPNHGLLSHSIGDSVMTSGELIDEAMAKITGYIDSGTADESTKQEPVDDETCVSLQESWQFLLDYTSESDLRDHGLDVELEVKNMQRVLRAAVREMQIYDDYLDKVYEERGETRMGRFNRKDPIPIH